MYREITLFVSVLFYGCISSEFSQEMAKVEYFNPKYISNFTMFTSRKDRSSAYLTNVNATTLDYWGNNVTFLLRYDNIKGDKEINTFTIAVCLGLQWPWIADWFDTYSDVPSKVCPIPPGTYHYFNIELPPKNVPFYLLNTDYKCRLVAHLTSSKEKILELSLVLRNRRKKGKKN